MHLLEAEKYPRPSQLRRMISCGIEFPVEELADTKSASVAARLWHGVSPAEAQNPFVFQLHHRRRRRRDRVKASRNTLRARASFAGAAAASLRPHLAVPRRS
jgi:hypothetical protein